MGAYRYLLFPRHQQPTVSEAAELQGYAPLLKGRWAIGHERKTEALAFLFDQDVFEQAMADDGFEMLIRKWQVHGCQLVDKLKFVKDPSSLKPSNAHAHGGTDIHEKHFSHERVVFAKKYLADEALAKSLLSVQHTLERMTWLERLGKMVPYAMMVLAMVGVLIAGLYVTQRVQNAERERRIETIERMAADVRGELNDITETDATTGALPADSSPTNDEAAP